jgi:hypothetical protein
VVLTERTVVLIVFPDDFLFRKVVAALTTAIARHPGLLPVLVTNEPARYERLLEVNHMLIVPRPVWAWAIYDAIRGHLAVGE